MRKLCCIISGKYYLYKTKNRYILEKAVFSIICNKCQNKDEKICKEEESIGILIILGFIENIQLL